MAQQWNLVWNNKGSTQTRTLTPSAPVLAENYRRITRITRYCGQYCKTGGTEARVYLACYDELIDGRTGAVILRSNTAQCNFNGEQVYSSRAYMTTEFSDISVPDSHLILAAWREGTLQVKRTVWVEDYDSRSHGSPYFKSNYSDNFTLEGTDSAYLPAITPLSFSAADENRLYASEWSSPPFDFKVQTDISPSEYWEDASSLCRQLEIRAKNLTNDTPAMMPLSISTTDAADTQWTISQADLSFLGFREEKGFLRGCRYRVDFIFSVGRDADNLTESTSWSIEIDKAVIPLHLSRRGRGVAIGQYSSLVEDLDGEETEDTLFECRYPAKFYGGIHGFADSVFQSGEVKTGGIWIDGRPIYRQVFTGSISETGDQTIGMLSEEPAGILNVQGCLNVNRIGYNFVYPIPFTDSDSISWSLAAVVRGVEVRLYVGGNFPDAGQYVLILEYIKASDAAAAVETVQTGADEQSGENGG